MMTTNGVNGGLTQRQAQWLVTLLREQSQSDALSALTNSATDGSTPSSGTDFASLLTSVLGDTSGTNSLQSLLGARGSPATAASLLSAASPSANPVTSTGVGNQIASIATQLAGDLRGTNNQFFDATQTPLAAQQTWQTPGWGNGNVQCVAFVAGVYHQAGKTLPATPNATDFWGTYHNLPGWTEVANGQALPQPGDIIALSGGVQGFGHVAVVTGVVPPTGGQPGRVTFAQANSPTSQGSLTIAPDGSVQAWPGYQVQGFIRAQG